MHTKEMIMEALQLLHDDYPREIANWNYRGPMDIFPYFTIKEIAEKIERTPNTTRKWCKVLTEDNKLVMKWKKCYSANDSMTMLFRRVDAQIVKLEGM